jgi:hypothetical protein
MRRSTLNRTRLLLTVSVLLGAGCATIQRLEATETGRMLAEAGFHTVAADTAEQQKNLGSMPPHRIVRRASNGKVEYTYADPNMCHCVYVGGETEYSEYEWLRTKNANAARGGASPSGGARGGAP